MAFRARKVFGTFEKRVSGHSTEYLMIHLTETWRTVIDCGKFVAVAFIDFRKAFDSVPHATLIMKLERHFGIKESTRDWLKSYLTGRKQFTVLNGVMSDLIPVSMGIPQGSVLGPTLFTLFTNDLSPSVRSVSLYMFSDDTNRLLHRKCAVRIFIHESQNFRNERVSVANE